MSLLHDLAIALAVLTLAYFAALNLVYLAFTGIAWRSLTRHLRARGHAPDEEVFSSPVTPPVSVLVPAYDEERTIVESVHSLLALRYPEHEVIVVNDGSSDATLEHLVESFDLVPVRKALRVVVPTAAIRGVYVSRRHRRLWVVDKENGGKADALNAGVNASRYPYVLAIDADAILEEDALLRVARPVIARPDVVVATGGIVRIANGCRVDHGRVLDVRLPSSRLATLQVLEYFRAFLIGRVGWSRMNALLIISGAFGLFRRALVEEVGGYSSETVGEDIELVVRLHRHLRDRDEPYRIEFVPDPVCWTEAPETMAQLQRQRRRWHRGLGETLWRHRHVAGNGRYGTLGTAAVPYFLVFEFLGPLVEVLGLPMIVVWWLLGDLSIVFLVGFLVVAMLLGVVLSLAALTLEEHSFRRHRDGRDIARLIAFSVVENIGYRQLVAVWRFLAFFDLLRGRRDWGAMQRKGFVTTAEAPLPQATRP
ncbi:MAG: glycosyltransferase family 2 protein [Gaiella sp.]|nr:glycosyltransferase family 2 protein [Gaiella sp.]